MVVDLNPRLVGVGASRVARVMAGAVTGCLLTGLVGGWDARCGNERPTSRSPVKNEAMEL